MVEYSTMSSAERRRACAAWYMLSGHRALWNVPIFAAVLIFILLLQLRGTGEDPEVNLRKSSAEVIAIQPKPIDDEVNAALDYQAAFALYAIYKGKRELDPTINLTRPSEYFEPVEVLEYVEANESATQRLRDAVQKSQTDWKLNYLNGVAVPLNHLSSLRQGVRLLAARARIAAHRGEHKEAARELETIYKMARHLESDPFMISFLVSNSMRSMADSAIESIVLFDTPVKAEDITGYRNVLDLEREAAPRIIRTLELEKVLLTYSIDLDMTKLAAGPAPAAFVGMGIPILPGGAMPWYGADRRCFVATLDEMMANARRGNLAANDDTEKIIARHQEGPAVFTSMVMPAFGRFHTTFQRSAEQGMLVDLGLAFLQYRAKYGRDAKTIDELIPEFLPKAPQSVFREQPVKLVVDPKGITFRQALNPITNKWEQLTIHPNVIRIYTFGKNGSDDQGIFSESGELREDSEKADDVSVRIPPLVPVAPPLSKEVRQYKSKGL